MYQLKIEFRNQDTREYDEFYFFETRQKALIGSAALLISFWGCDESCLDIIYHISEREYEEAIKAHNKRFKEECYFSIKRVSAKIADKKIIYPSKLIDKARVNVNSLIKECNGWHFSYQLDGKFIKTQKQKSLEAKALKIKLNSLLDFIEC